MRGAERFRETVMRRLGALWELARARPRTATAITVALLFLVLWAKAHVGDGSETVLVRRGPLVLGVEVTGVLRAVDSDLLGPPQVPRTWNFKIAMMADEGVVVKKGAPVLGFDVTDLRRELDNKLAESATARTQMEKQRAQLEVNRRDGDLKVAEAESSLRKTKMKLGLSPELTSANELKVARLDEGLFARQVESLGITRESDQVSGGADWTSLEQTGQRAESRVAEIREAIARMSVAAPRDGTVIYLTNGQEVKKKVGDQCWVAEKILEVADLNKMKGEGEVAESDSGNLVAGQRVNLRLDAHPDLEFPGRIQSVWQALQPKSPANPLKVVKVDIALDTTDPRRMMPGMRFVGTVETGRVKGALFIPPDAILETPEGPRARVRGLFGWQSVSLSLGHRTKDAVEILSGLSEGDEVALVGRQSREQENGFRLCGADRDARPRGGVRAPPSRFGWIGCTHPPGRTRGFRLEGAGGWGLEGRRIHAHLHAGIRWHLHDHRLGRGKRNDRQSG
jgi:multidrug resistance efflux pump